MLLSSLKPEKAFMFFEEICQIPHGSGNEGPLFNYLVNFAKSRNLETYTDETLNVLIKKGGSKGYETAQPVILQAHFDMVCEKNSDTIFDFTTDSLKLQIQDYFVTATGTTLGADNCAAVAMALAVLDSDEYSHPPLEVLLTTGEETGMFGAAAFDCTQLKGRKLLNIDSEEEGVFTVSCAGGLRANIGVPIEFTPVSETAVAYTLGIRGLAGGHSGMEIHLGRGNANILLARVLDALTKETAVFVSQINGGAQDNAIPREATATIHFEPSDLEKVREIVNRFELYFKFELAKNEISVNVLLEPSTLNLTQTFTNKTLKKCIAAILLCPNGVLAMSLDIENLVETSNNIGVLATNGNEFIIHAMVRSSVESRKEMLVAQIKMLCDLIGASLSLTNNYGGWHYAVVSPLRDLLAETFETMYGKKPVIGAIHAGLECGMFGQKIENIDMISFGPDISFAHTPMERLSIPSFSRTWDFLLEVLKNLK